MKSWINLKEEIIDKDLCTTCGTCIGSCPKNIISFDKKEKLVCRAEECISCGKCSNVCPGGNFNYVEFNKDIFDESIENIDLDIGSYIEIKKGWSLNSKIRNNASSGGIVSEIILYLLKEKLIDGVVSVVPKENNKIEYEVKIIKNIDELKLAAKSKYMLLPTNSIIQELTKLNGKYVYVGLPCQIQGIRKAAKYIKNLDEKIYLYIGIFCGFNMSKKATEFLINKSKIDRSKIKQIEYRAKVNGKTGFRILSENNEEFFVGKHEYTILNLFYSPKRCWKCFDLTSEFADISIGDAWEEKECSRIIIRNNKAQDIIERMNKEKKIEIKKSSKKDIILTQKQLISYKKREIFIRKKIMKDFPDYNIKQYNLRLSEKIKGSIFFICLNIAHSEFGKIILNILPMKFIGQISTILRSILKRNKSKEDS